MTEPVSIPREAKVYVAGHQGLVGSAICRRLQTAGFSHVVTRARSELDLCDQRAVLQFFQTERPSHVFLAAARVGGILANSTYPADFIRDNLQIQTNVIDAAWRSGAKKLLFLGSSCIYPKDCPQPMREEHLLTGPLEPTNEWYAVAKIAGVKMCQAYRRQHGFNAVSLMPTNLYGPGDNFDLETSHALPALIRKFHLAKLANIGGWKAIEADERRWGPISDDIKASLGFSRSRITNHLSRGRPAVVLWGTGAPRREFLHVDDLADACLFLAERYEGEGIVNVGVSDDISIGDVAEMLRDVVGFNGPIVYDTSKPDGTPRKLLDVARLTSLGWRARIPLGEGIKATYRWFVENGEAGEVKG